MELENNKNLYKKLELFNLMHLFGIFLFLILLGDVNFFINDSKNGILIAIGFLTFISIFFNFLFLSDYKEQISLIHQLIDILNKEKKGSAITKLKSGKILESRKLTGEILTLKSIKNFLYPIQWLYFSIFCYLISITFGLSSNTYYLKDYLPSINMGQALLFNLGFVFTIYLVVSIFGLSFIVKKNNKLKKKK